MDGVENIIKTSHCVFAGVWTGLKTVVVVEIVGLSNLSNALGVMLFVQGFAAFIGSPLAGICCTPPRPLKPVYVGLSEISNCIFCTPLRNLNYFVF